MGGFPPPPGSPNPPAARRWLPAPRSPARLGRRLPARARRLAAAPSPGGGPAQRPPPRRSAHPAPTAPRPRLRLRRRWRRPKAGFWARFAALLIDGIITGLFCVPACIALGDRPHQDRVPAASTRRATSTSTAPCRTACARCPPAAPRWAIFGVPRRRLRRRRSSTSARLEGRHRAVRSGRQALGIRVVDIGDRPAHRRRPGDRPLLRPHPVVVPVRPRLLLDAVGPAEADLARQDRQQRRRQGLALRRGR